MDSFTFEDDISILTHEALRDDGGWADEPNTELTGEEYSASHFALVTAYNDIKQRLIGMERENYSLKRKLRHYDLKFSLSNDFGEEQPLSPRQLDILVLRTENAHLREQLDELHNQVGRRHPTGPTPPPPPALRLFDPLSPPLSPCPRLPTPTVARVLLTVCGTLL
uniref:Uncharacterized protein n=1 Tax=Callorhinchus milii TaxID=7868 RepID=A0A4W3GCE8_CALMI